MITPPASRATSPAATPPRFKPWSHKPSPPGVPVIDLDSGNPKEENQEWDEALREGLRRSLEHTKGASSPPGTPGAQSSCWREGASPTKKARVIPSDGQGGDEYGTPEGAAEPPGEGGMELDETARFSPAYGPEPPKAPGGAGEEETLPGEVPPIPENKTAGDQHLIQLLNSNMEALFAKSNSLMIDSMKNLQINVDQKLESAKAELRQDLRMSEQEQKTTLNSMQRKIDDNASELKVLAGRLSDLEKGAKGGTTTAAPRAAQDTPPRGDDPWRTRDPWTRSPAAPSPPPSTSPFTPSRKELSDTGFVPSAVFIKGWGQYGSHRGLPMGEAQALGLQLKAKLTPDLQDKIASIQAPYLMNHRIMLKIKEPGEDCWKVRNALADILKATPVRAMGKEVYAIVEPGPVAKKRTQLTARARAALCKQIEDEKDIQVDYRAGHIYWSADLILVGKILKRDETLIWKWLKDSLGAYVINLDWEKLESDMQEEE